METREGLCGICPAGCWVNVGLEGGRIVRADAREGHPLGMICTIGRHSPQIVHDPHRLAHPLRRVGPRGSGRFERVGWEEAMGAVVEALERVKGEQGPEGAAIYTGRGSFDMALCDIFQPQGVAVSSASSVLFPYGSPNTLGVGALCYVSFAMIAPHVTLGEMLITMDTDIEQAELIVLWGANPATDSPPLAHHQILRARARGAQVIAIDPRRSETAIESGAEWIPIRPGTDGALALGLLQVLLEEELHDESLAPFTVGLEDLGRLAQHYRPEVVEGITGVPQATVRRLARSIAMARGACPVMYTGLEYSDSGVQAIRAVLCLWALAGQLDVPGGLVIRMRDNIFPQNRTALVANPDVRKALGRERFPLYSAYRGESHAMALPKAVVDHDPYAIRALIVLGGSLITAWPNPDLWRRTLDSLDFLAVIDRYLTADGAYADIVLPATTMYEITSYMRYGPLFKIRERIIEPVGEARSDFAILADLAARLGYGHLYPQDDDALLRHALAGTAFTLEEVRRNGGEARVGGAMMEYRKWEKGLLRPDGARGFNTPSGKVELASSLLAEHGYDPLPVYTEPAEGPLSRPDLARPYPLVFNSGARTPYDFRSQHHGVRGLREMAPEPLVTLNDRDAADRGIVDGDWVLVESPRGRVRFRARVTTDIVAGAIDAAMGGGGPWGPRAWVEANVNALTDENRYDPISGFPIYKALLCQVVRDEDQGGGALRAAREAIEGPLPEPERPPRQVYLDHNATAPLDPEVGEAMGLSLKDRGGNPSSIHGRGRGARAAVEEARRQVAEMVNCTARRIVFTAGGTEANNLAIKGAVGQGGHIIVSAVEHPSVLAPCRALAARGFEVTFLGVDHQGLVDPGALDGVIRPDTRLVSVMVANNEVGAIQPVAEVARVAHGRGVLVHADGVQALGKVPLDVGELGVDLLTLSAHKVHGPQGVGALYVRQGVTLEPLIHGGGQEHGLRSGTENVAGLVGFGRACALARRRLGEARTRLAGLRDRLERGILELLPGARRLGPPERRLANTVCLVLPAIRGESLVLQMSRRGVCFSSGSACQSGHPDPSHVLLAMGLSSEEAHCAVRFSLGQGNTEEDVAYTLRSLAEILREAAGAVRFVGCR